MECGQDLRMSKRHRRRRPTRRPPGDAPANGAMGDLPSTEWQEWLPAARIRMCLEDIDTLVVPVSPTQPPATTDAAEPATSADEASKMTNNNNSSQVSGTAAAEQPVQNGSHGQEQETQGAEVTKDEDS
eukprot:m.502423 g.502423  ORF g.502423 m.502423 type:complete len:129 (+) comp21842_c1_seq48:2349-2735(+)